MKTVAGELVRHNYENSVLDGQCPTPTEGIYEGESTNDVALNFN
jgi:hypothetical protein